ncbi:MAG: pentapeptide repeat-containing protein [Ktedonobacteraceae bacterium]
MSEQQSNPFSSLKPHVSENSSIKRQVVDPSWRIEAEITIDRQKELAQYRAIIPDIAQGIYPFKGVKLTRADVEWLLTTHENGLGPIDWSDEQQRNRDGLDLRGANLCKADLHGLPLARLRAGLTWEEWLSTSPEQRRMAEVHLVEVNLSRAHLEQARLGMALLKRAILSETYLQGGDLFGTHLEQANLSEAFMQGANFRQAHLQGANIQVAHLDMANFRQAHLERANLSYAHLGEVDFIEAHLEGVQFNNAHFEGTDFDGVRLEVADDKFWQAYWQALDQPWRIEPEISIERQRELAQYRAIIPDIAEGIYPFKGVKLTRADVEWLLTTHENGLGPIDWSDEQQRNRDGLDLRGTNLDNEDLHGLPLARLRAGLTWEEWLCASLGQRCTAEVHLSEANLSKAHLEGANLRQAHLEGSNLSQCYLQIADLSEIKLENANFRQAHLEKADLFDAHIEHASLREAHLEDANLSLAHLESADLSLAHLEGADLRKTHFNNANLFKAHLENTNLMSSYLQNAELGLVHLEGANLSEAHLEGANLSLAHLEGKHIPSIDLKRINQWIKNFPDVLEPADLRRAFFDAATNLQSVILGNEKFGFASIADIRWGNVNLAVVDWTSVKELGDERIAHQKTTSVRTPKLKSFQLDDYHAAVRANRQLAVLMQAQGLNEDATHFAYRAHVLQREVLRRQAFLRQAGQRQLGLRQRLRKFLAFIFSLILYLLAGYGYRTWRSLVAYICLISVFGVTYFSLGTSTNSKLSLNEAIIVSITAFHGRGFFFNQFTPGAPQATVAAIESIIGLLMEIIFIATFTQRYFGK